MRGSKLIQGYPVTFCRLVLDQLWVLLSFSPTHPLVKFLGAFFFFFYFVSISERNTPSTSFCLITIDILSSCMTDTCQL